MLYGRSYTVPFSNVSVTALQDLFALYTASNLGPIMLDEVRLGQISSPFVANLRIEFHVLTPTVAAGSGGTTPTPVPEVPGDAAALTTAHVNDTTPATVSGGGVDTLWFADVYNVVNGYLYQPAPKNKRIISRTNALIIKLPVAPASAQSSNGTITFTELF